MGTRRPGSKACLTTYVPSGLVREIVRTGAKLDQTSTSLGTCSIKIGACEAPRAVEDGSYCCPRKFLLRSVPNSRGLVDDGTTESIVEHVESMGKVRRSVEAQSLVSRSCAGRALGPMPNINLSCLTPPASCHILSPSMASRTNTNAVDNVIPTFEDPPPAYHDGRAIERLPAYRAGHLARHHPYGRYTPSLFQRLLVC